MSRRAWWWLLVALLLVFDVVTVVFHLVAPGWQIAILGVTAVLLGVYGALRLVERRAHRRDAASARAQLDRLHSARTG